MQIYLVGGAVRDALLGLPVKDRDWVVVGCTPEDMIQRGFVPVGKDFPVFLHPHSHEEYALARTERKIAPGYHGFAIHAAPKVTLEDDLARRDITINSIAVRANFADTLGAWDAQVALSPEHWKAAGVLVDPHNGLADLQARVLRHVSAAFCEDPVRILRVARLAARFANFSLAPQTLALMRGMVASGEVNHLVPERVWQELAKGLMEATPSRMLAVLRDCRALDRLLPDLPRYQSVRPDDTLDLCAHQQAPLAVRAACLLYPLSPAMYQHLRLPNDCRALATLMAREHDFIAASAKLDAEALVRLLERCDAFRKPQRFADLLQACECHLLGHCGQHTTACTARPRLLTLLTVAQQVTSANVVPDALAAGTTGKLLGQHIHQARVAAVQSQLLAMLVPCPVC